MQRLLDLGRRFAACRSGNALIIFALAISAMCGTAGLAIDFSRMHAAKLSAQQALDAALLAAARNQTIDTSGVNALVNSYIAAPGTMKHDASITGLHGELESSSVLKAEAMLHVPTTLMKVLGQSTIAVPIRSRVVRGLGNVEIALVLDTTFSMSFGSRLTSLKSAANQLIDTLYDLPDAANKVKVSLVPFAQYVNVGMQNRNASWMSVPTDSSSTNTSYQCWNNYPNAVKSNCRMELVTYYNDGTAYEELVEVCDWDYGAPVNVCEDVTTTTTLTWNGCAGARSSPLNIKDESYGTPIPGVMNVSCPSPILPLTNNPSDIKSSIDGMVAVGDTYIPTGIVWGWRTLSNRAPFTQSAEDPHTANGTVRKYMVLMTDGENFRSPRYPEGDHEGGDIALSNQLTRDVCDNVRADTQSKIEIFTIAFAVASEPIKDILRYCATPGGAFFDAVDYSQLLAAFGEIGNSVSVARVAQ